ncbi:MAG: hypothetical protein KGO49_09230 [Gammaproteobacteria bacterium]|nr:hypothetical protein [Gammaproteobacteria bacterium]
MQINFESNDVPDAAFKKLDIKRNTLACHSSATTAFLAWIDAPKKVFTPLLNNQTPIYLIRADTRFLKPAYFFYSSFELVNSLHLTQVSNLPSLIIRDVLDPDYIEKQAWHELIKLATSPMLCPKLGLPFLRNIINQKMPERLIYSFFHSTKVTVDELCKLNDTTRSQFYSWLPDFNEKFLADKTHFTLTDIIKAASS